MGGKQKIVSKKALEAQETQAQNKAAAAGPVRSEASPATVMELIGKTGVFGEVNQIMCKILAGRDQGRVIRRNVKGPVRVGDTLMLLETEREAKPLKKKKAEETRGRTGTRPPARRY